ncbi:MAG: IS3 family transposase [Verrucomicrobia bacterium]|nr:IS3 family transposase [Verrucomicrobiota bacterium]
MTTRSNPKAEAAPNYLDQNFLIDEPNKVWVSDITYVKTENGWLYVAVVLDLFSRKVIGLRMGESLETNLVKRALSQALRHRSLSGELLHHSDRGCQYTSKEFKELSKKHGIKLSMSGKGHCYDNAVAESFFHTLKTEYIYLCGPKNREAMKRNIFEYIEVFYNRERLHSVLGYRTPEEYERIWRNKREDVA